MAKRTVKTTSDVAKVRASATAQVKKLEKAISGRKKILKFKTLGGKVVKADEKADAKKELPRLEKALKQAKMVERHLKENNSRDPAKRRTKQNIVNDAKKKAKKSGKRKSTKKGSTSNQYGTYKNKTGRTYWESRPDRSDARPDNKL